MLAQHPSPKSFREEQQNFRFLLGYIVNQRLHETLPQKPQNEADVMTHIFNLSLGRHREKDLCEFWPSLVNYKKRLC